MLKAILILLLLPAAALAQSLSWEEQMLAAVNDQREYANQRELAIYGYLERERLPLRLNPTLSESGKWWAQALKGTGLMAHGWYTNSAGYLVSEPGGSQISRVWLPASAGWTDFTMRNFYLGLRPAWQSENGYFGRSTDPAFVVTAWATSGWNDDPRLVRGGHYANLIDPDLTDCGAARNAWGAGKSSVWLEVAAFQE